MILYLSIQLGLEGKTTIVVLSMWITYQIIVIIDIHNMVSGMGFHQKPYMNMRVMERGLL